MNKAQFLAELRRRISQLPLSEIDKSAAYYEEMIDDRIEDGKTELEAVAALEDVGVIAERILQDVPIHTLVKSKVRPKGGWTALAVVLIVLGSPLWVPLVLAIGALIFSFYVLVWSLLAGFLALIGGILIGGVAALIGAPFFLSRSPGGAAFLAGGALTCIGLGIVLVLAAKSAVAAAVRLSARIGRGIKSIFIRKDR